ncbi:hypothetical protein, partial [Streptomyces mirabilis]
MGRLAWRMAGVCPSGREALRRSRAVAGGFWRLHDIDDGVSIDRRTAAPPHRRTAAPPHRRTAAP